MDPESSSSKRVVVYGLLALLVALTALSWFYFYGNTAAPPETKTPLTEADKAAILDSLNSTTTPQTVDERSPDYSAKIDILESLKQE